MINIVVKNENTTNKSNTISHNIMGTNFNNNELNTILIEREGYFNYINTFIYEYLSL